jgi:hypothetical protein
MVFRPEEGDPEFQKLRAQEAEIDAEQDPPVRLSEVWSSICVTRESGRRLLSRFGFPKKVDFSGVTEASWSFLDEYVGKTAQRAIDKGGQLPELLNVPESIRGSLEQVFEHRGIPFKLPRRGE